MIIKYFNTEYASIVYPDPLTIMKQRRFVRLYINIHLFKKLLKASRQQGALCKLLTNLKQQGLKHKPHFKRQTSTHEY